MLGRLLAAAAAIVAAVCVATVMAEGLMLAYLHSRGKLDKQTVQNMIAVANGVEFASNRAPRADAESTREQASLDDVARARALKSRDLELREQALSDDAAIVKTEYAKLVDEKDRYERIKTAFRAQLDELRAGALAENRETARGILENMKAKQAKDQILRMVKGGEMTDVIKILSLMPGTKRKKILDEFKTDDEAKTLADILKQIREGKPETNLVDEAERSLAQPDRPTGDEETAAP